MFPRLLGVHLNECISKEVPGSGLGCVQGSWGPTDEYSPAPAHGELIAGVTDAGTDLDSVCCVMAEGGAERGELRYAE